LTTGNSDASELIKSEITSWLIPINNNTLECKIKIPINGSKWDPWRSKDGDAVIAYSTNKDGLNGNQQVIKTILRAASTWNNIECSIFKFEIDTPPFITPIEPPLDDGKPYIGWYNYPFWYGFTYWCFNEQTKNRECDIELSSYYEDYWCIEGEIQKDEFDLETIVLHELGHSLGLAHSNRSKSVMYPFIFRGHAIRVLDEDDINGICTLYRKYTSEIQTDSKN